MSNMSQRTTSSQGGYLYLIRCRETTYYKIGVCFFSDTEARDKKNLENRIRTLQTGCPFELVYIHLASYPSHIVQHEQAVHNKYWKRRVLGEWFVFTDMVIGEVIKEMDNITRKVKKYHPKS